MKLPTLELKKALVKRLSGNISCEICPNTNEKTQFPFVKLGTTTTIDDGTKTDDRTNNTYVINVFSQYDSDTETQKIMNEIIEQITKAPLLLNGFEINVCKLEMARTFEEYDDKQTSSKTKTWHGVLIFRFKIREL